VPLALHSRYPRLTRAHSSFVVEPPPQHRIR
jgi:hypothetical protein